MALIGLGLSSALLLSACGGETDTSKLDPKVSVESGNENTEPETVEPEEPADDIETDDPVDEPVEPDAPANDQPAASGDYQVPEWANDVNEVGELLQAYKNDYLEYEIYQVATGEAASDSMWIDADTEEPLLKEGDPVVAFNVIVTNISDEEIPMSISFVNLGLDYADSQYLQGAMRDINDEWLEELGLNSQVYKEFRTPAIFPLAPGESVAIGEIYEYHAGDVTMSLDFTPVDDEGQLDFDSPLQDRAKVEFSLE